MYFKQIFEQIINENFSQKKFNSIDDFEKLIDSLKNNEYVEWYYHDIHSSYAQIIKKDNNFYYFLFGKPWGDIDQGKIEIYDAIDLLWKNRKLINKYGLNRDTMKTDKILNIIKKKSVN